jgi:hypothetical protein
MVTCFVKGLTYADKGPLHITPVLANRLVQMEVLKPGTKLGWFVLNPKEDEDMFWRILRKVW